MVRSGGGSNYGGGGAGFLGVCHDAVGGVGDSFCVHGGGRSKSINSDGVDRSYCLKSSGGVNVGGVDSCWFGALIVVV